MVLSWLLSIMPEKEKKRVPCSSSRLKHFVWYVKWDIPIQFFIILLSATELKVIIKIVSIIFQAIYLIFLEGQEISSECLGKGPIKKKKVTGGRLNHLAMCMQVLSISNLVFQIRLHFYSKSCIYLIQNLIFIAQREHERKSSSELSFDKHYDYGQIKALYTYIFANCSLCTTDAFNKQKEQPWKLRSSFIINCWFIFLLVNSF